MKNKGFTLAELLGVIVIISILAIVILPPIINQFRKTEDRINDTTMKLIESATLLHMDNNKNTYPLVDSATYCITIGQLIEADILASPVLYANGSVIPQTRIVRVLINTVYDIDYSLVDTCP
jgi:prepilin-type N-terminal cleavage/methylation domain-containing protein